MTFRAWALRRAMGRLRITDDILRHVSTFQRLGETVRVRQWWVGDGPIVETAMRVPGGDAIHRVFAITTDEDLAVLEIENRSPSPFAVAFAVRPYNPEGLAVVERIALLDRTVTVDGRPALLFTARPLRMAGSTFRDGDSARLVTAGLAGDALPPRLPRHARYAYGAGPFRLPGRRGQSPAAVPPPPTPRRLLLQPAPGVGRQRRRPPRVGRALAPVRRPRRGRHRVGRPGARLDRAQAAQQAAPQGRS